MNSNNRVESCNNASVRSIRSIGSGTFSTDQRITLNVFGSSLRHWRCTSNTDTHTKGRRNPLSTVACSATTNATAVDDAREDVKVVQLVYEDDNISLSVASDAPEDVQQSLKDMSLYSTSTNNSNKNNSALLIVSSGTSTNTTQELLPQLTTSSTSTQSSSVSSEDGAGDSSSPGSSLCGSDRRTNRQTIRRSHQHQLDGEEECCSSNDSYCSSSDEIKMDSDIIDHSEQHEATAAVLSTTTPCLRSPPDMYGQQHPIETEALIDSKLHEFNQRIQHATTTFHHSATMNLQHQTLIEPKFLIAERVCPNISTSSFKLLFLRCECYNVENSIKRYTKYWEKRVELFGPIRAYQPITVQSLYDHNDHTPLETGAMQIIYRSDPTKRNLLWFDPSKLDPTKYTRESGCRAFWYIFHSYLEDELVQQQGMICLAFFQHFLLKNRDPTFTRMCIQSVQGCIPIRVSAFHGCHPPKYVRCILAVFLILIGDRLRKRVLVHGGLFQHVNEILESKYNISNQCIPTVMGGENQLSIRNWIQQRKVNGV